MTSIIHFTPVSGALQDDTTNDASEESPPCYLLRIDEFTLLLDCGADETFNIDYISNLKEHISNIDAVLLSYADTHHIGALPYLVGKCGLSCPIYATTPVYQMGQMFAYDLYLSRHNYEEFDVYNLDDVDQAYEKVVQVKYNQTIALKESLTVTPLCAGHMLGGTIWRIVKDGEEDILYAVDFNHKQERHLNGCDLDKINRPSLLITDCLNINHAPEQRKRRDEMLFRCIRETISSSGSVLIAVDTGGRVLELAYMLEQTWRSDPSLSNLSLLLLNTMAFNVVEFAKSMVEWLNDKLNRTVENHRINPFNFRHLQLCHSISEINRRANPMVVLASQPDLECGLSRETLFSFANNPNNTIILTQRSFTQTLSDLLIRQAENVPFPVKITRKRRVPLSGKELEEYLERKREEDEKEKILENGKEKDEDESDEESDEDYFDEEFNQVKRPSESKELKRSESNMSTSGLASSAPKHDLMMSRMDGRVKGGGFFKNMKKSYPMYPCVERKLKWDEYGEVINPEEFSVFDVSRMLLEEKENHMEEMKLNGETNDTEQVQKQTHLEIPTKCIEDDIELNIEARIEFIDFEGRSDGESLKKIVTMIKPRRLILVRANSEKIEQFSSFCLASECVISGKIFAPRVLEMVDATTERHIYQVKLRDALVSSLRFAECRDGAKLAWIEAEVSLNNPESLLPQANDDQGEEANKLDRNVIIVGQRSGRELMPTLQQLPAAERTAQHETIFVNELKLSDFKQTLLKHGVQAEFARGVLLCNGKVEVKRTESGRIHLEGTICDDYFKIRQLLYEQYAIL